VRVVRNKDKTIQTKDAKYLVCVYLQLLRAAVHTHTHPLHLDHHLDVVVGLADRADLADNVRKASRAAVVLTDEILPGRVVGLPLLDLFVVVVHTLANDAGEHSKAEVIAPTRVFVTLAEGRVFRVDYLTGIRVLEGRFVLALARAANAEAVAPLTRGNQSREHLHALLREDVDLLFVIIRLGAIIIGLSAIIIRLGVRVVGLLELDGNRLGIGVVAHPLDGVGGSRSNDGVLGGGRGHAM
jgi:hypothetical protein